MSYPPSAGSPFPDTSWSMVARAAHATTTLRRRTLEAFLKQYLPALRAYFMARHRIGPHEADDLLQGFMTSKVLEQQILARADRTRGRFRTFLMTALERYAISEYRKATCARRSPRDGGRELVSLEDVDEAEHPTSEAADLFDLAWAKQTVEVAVGRMHRECERRGRDHVWAVFKARVLGPTLAEVPPVPYEQLVAKLGLASPQQASNLLATAKRMFGRSLREVVAEYAMDEADVAEEVRRLKRILSAGARA